MSAPQLTGSSLRLVHMVSSIGHEASGPSYSVPRLCRALAERGHQVELHVYRWTEQTPEVPGVAVMIHPLLAGPFPRKLGISPAMRRGIARAATSADVVHSHGLWMMSNVYAATAAVAAGTKLVTSPRGALAAPALRRSRIEKRIMWAMRQRAAVRAVDMFHATASAELEDIRRVGMRGRPVALIPNGVDVPDIELEPRSESRARRRVLFLGRVHPIKGVDLLLRAWRSLEPVHPGWELDIVGPAEGSHGEMMRRLAKSLALERVRFLPGAYGEAKQRAYAEADIFVLPSESENFGMVVAEALSMAVPVVVTHGAPWAAIEQERCGHWIERTEQSLVHAVGALIRVGDEERAAMGMRGRAWMLRDFSWQAIAGRFEAAYAGLLGRGALSKDVEMV